MDFHSSYKNTIPCYIGLVIGKILAGSKICRRTLRSNSSFRFFCGSTRLAQSLHWRRYFSSLTCREKHPSRKVTFPRPSQLCRGTCSDSSFVYSYLENLTAALPTGTDHTPKTFGYRKRTMIGFLQRYRGSPGGLFSWTRARITTI